MVSQESRLHRHGARRCVEYIHGTSTFVQRDGDIEPGTLTTTPSHNANANVTVRPSKARPEPSKFSALSKTLATRPAHVQSAIGGVV